MVIPHFVHLFTSSWILHFLAVMTDVAMNSSVQIFVGLYDINDLGYMKCVQKVSPHVI